MGSASEHDITPRLATAPDKVICNHTLKTSCSYDPASQLLSVLHKVGTTTTEGAT